jgi:hypothetical protein
MNLCRWPAGAGFGAADMPKWQPWLPFRGAKTADRGGRWGPAAAVIRETQKSIWAWSRAPSRDSLFPETNWRSPWSFRPWPFW